MKKIDIHCHTSNRSIRDVEHHNPTIETISSLMKKYEIEKTVVLATYFPHKQSGISNFRLYDWIRGNEDFLMFGSLDFEHYPKQGLNELEEMACRKIIKGIKIYTCYQEVDFRSETFREVLRIAKVHNLPIMFHTGLSYAAMRKYDSPTVAKMFSAKHIEEVCIEHHNVNFILSHMSKPFFEEIREVCDRFHNVYTDMSGLIDSFYDKAEIASTVEEIRCFLDYCGPEKLLFGTDFPVQTHEHSIYFIEEAMKFYTNDEKRMVYYNNAHKLLYRG